MDTPQPTPTQQPTTPAVLPAPLYFLALSGTTPQIWRIETNGTTRSQITQEAAGVTDFDVSPRDGSLAYVSGNALITADGLGGNDRFWCRARRWLPNAMRVTTQRKSPNRAGHRMERALPTA